MATSGMKFTTLSIAFFIFLWDRCVSEKFSGTIKVDKTNGFVFMGKFAFDYTRCQTRDNITDDCLDQGNHAGEVDLNLVVEHPPDGLVGDTDAEVLFFDDQPDSWETVYKKNLNCSAIISRSKTPGRHLINWSQDGDIVIYDEIPISINQHVRPRFWYIAIADCNSVLQTAGEIHFSLSLDNVNEGAWSIEFGVDQRGLNTLYIFYTFVYVFLVTIQCLNIQMLKSTGNLHPMVQLFTIALFLQLCAMICLLIHWVTFTYDGTGVEFLDIFGDVLEIFAQLTFMLLLILIAQGWTITEHAIYHRKQLIGGIFVFAVLYIVALLLKRALDPASTAYIYNSVPGIMVAVANVLAGCWFLYSIVQSHRKENDAHKQSLYTKVAFIFGPWFLALPFEILIASLVQEWMRDIVVTTLSLTITTAAMGGMSFLLWPSRANKYFAITESNIGGGRGGDAMLGDDNEYGQL